MERRKVIDANFYATSSGKMPVREWLMSLDKRDRVDIGGDIDIAKKRKKEMEE